MDLFLSSEQVFEKVAGETTLPDDPNVWPREILQELYKQVPYVADFHPHVSMDKVDAEKGYGMGHIEVANQTEIQSGADPVQVAAAGVRTVRIPIIVKNKKMSPLDILITDSSKVVPLTESRLRQAIFRPQAFDITSKTPGDQSMIGQLYPPFRQNMGMGGGGGGLSMNAGMGKEGAEKCAECGKTDCSCPAMKKKASSKKLLRKAYHKAHTAAAEAVGNYRAAGHMEPVDYRFREKALTLADKRENQARKFSKALQKSGGINHRGELASPMHDAQQLSKKASILNAILPTINTTDYLAFVDALNDPYTRTAFVKNAASTQAALTTLLNHDPTSVKHASVGSLVHPTVTQISRDVDGYKIKSASHHYWAPTEEIVDRGEVVRRYGTKVALAADMSGAATLTEGATAMSEEAPSEEPRPIEASGMYKVRDEQGRELLGAVITNLIDTDGTELPLALFTNGSQSAVQADIVGIPAGGTPDLPSDLQVHGDGAFYSVEDGVLKATIPMTFGSGYTSSPDEPDVHVGSTFDGREVEVSQQPNIQMVMGTEEGKMLVPAHWKWLPLTSSESVKLTTTEGDEEKSAAARVTYASVEVRCGGQDSFSVSGPAVEKLASEDRSFLSLDDTMFLLSGLGVDQVYGGKKLAQSMGAGAPVMVRIGRSIKMASDRDEDALAAAAEKLASIPSLKCYLFKEAASIPDPTAVDTILSLGFINPENMMTFMGYLPVIDDAQSKICELLLASRLGLQDVPTSALEKAVRSTEEILEGLKILAFQGN